MEIPKRNTILLKGIYYDQVKTAFDCMISESLVNVQTPTYDIASNQKSHSIAAVIPTKFKTITQWKDLTRNLQIRCWHCSLPVSGVACFVPTTMKRTPSGIEFDVHGYYCGFACAYAYLRTNADMRMSRNYIDRIQMLKILYTKFHNATIKDFYQAPSVTSMDNFGGSMEVQDYKRAIAEMNDRMKAESAILDLVE